MFAPALTAPQYFKTLALDPGDKNSFRSISFENFLSSSLYII